MTTTPARTNETTNVPRVGTLILIELLLHGWMSTDQIIRRVAHLVKEDRTRQVLGDLRRAGLAANVRQTITGEKLPNLPHVWRATPKAKAALEGTKELHNARVADPPTDLQMKLITLSHNLAVNELGMHLEAAARAKEDQPMWMNEVMFFIADTGPKQERKLFTDLLFIADRPEPDDMLATLRVACELDKGTEAPSVLVSKQRQYEQFRTFTPKGANHPMWHNYLPPIPNAPQHGFPQVLYVFDCKNADRRADQFVNGISSPKLAPDLADSDLWTQVTTMERLQTYGAYDTRTFFDVYRHVNTDLWGDALNGPCIWPPRAAERGGLPVLDEGPPQLVVTS